MWRNEVRQAKRSKQRTVVLGQYAKQMPAKDFYEAHFSGVSCGSRLMDISRSCRSFEKRAGPQRVWRFIRSLPFDGVLGLGRSSRKTWQRGHCAISNSVRKHGSGTDAREQGLCPVVKTSERQATTLPSSSTKRTSRSPMTATMPKQRQPRLLWLRSPAITKEAFKASVVLISSEHGYPFKLAKAGLNLVDIKNIVIAPEVPPRDMFEMLTDHWGMGHRLARLFVATYGGSIDAVYTALGNLINNRKQFYPLGTTSVPGIGICLDQARCWQVLFCVSRGKAGSHLNSF